MVLPTPPTLIKQGNNNPNLKWQIAEWNTHLKAFTWEFKKRHSDIFIDIYDAAKVINRMLDNPSKFGFKDAISSCRTAECVWKDQVHPTFAAQRILAEHFAAYLEGAKFIS
jgi:phospholipase/lecithinase/hemolysin